MSLSTLTSKGQITIPKNIRDLLSISTGDKLEVIWVLKSAYSVSRQDIMQAISDLLQMQVFEFENQKTLRDFVITANK